MTSIGLITYATIVNIIFAMFPLLKKYLTKSQLRSLSDKVLNIKGNYKSLLHTDLLSSPYFLLYYLILLSINATCILGSFSLKTLKRILMSFLQRGHFIFYCEWSCNPNMHEPQYECPHVVETSNTLGSARQMQHSLSLYAYR